MYPRVFQCGWNVMMTMMTGSGAFSEVKKATRKEDGLTVAIKCIPRQKLSQHEVCALGMLGIAGSSKLSVLYVFRHLCSLLLPRLRLSL